MITLVKKSNCCGCRACEQICPRGCISVEPDNCGFLYPVIDEGRCIDCGLCNSVCPIIHPESNLRDTQRVYAMAHKDVYEVMHSSSGGVWGGICKWGIDNGYIIYGVVFDTDWKTVYKKASTIEECDAFRGSKYIQCNPSNTFEDIKKELKKGEKVIFSGTPCYVKALRNFLRKDYDSLITVDLICHGIPSPAVWASYIKFLEKNSRRKVISINMRDKRLGWNHRSLTSVRFNNNKEICNTPSSNTYMDGFGQEIFYRPSCYECRFANTNRPGDITLGDFWGIDEYTSTFEGIQGVSCCLSNTIKGEHIIAAIQSEYQTEERPFVECLQPNLKHPTEKNTKVDLFWNDWGSSNGNFKVLAKKYFGYTIKKRVKYFIKQNFPFLRNIKK